MTVLCDPCFDDRAMPTDDGVSLAGVQPATWTFDVPTGNPLIDDRKAACDQHILVVLREIVEVGGFKSMRVWREDLGSLDDDRQMILDSIKNASSIIAVDPESVTARSDLAIAVKGATEVGLSADDVFGAMGPIVHELWVDAHGATLDTDKENVR